MTIARSNLKAVLRENGVKINAHFLEENWFAKSKEYKAIADGITEAIIIYAKYGVNNGFDEIKGKISGLADIEVKCSEKNNQPIVVRVSELKKDAEKNDKNIKKYFSVAAPESLGIPNNYCLNISQKVKEIVSETIKNAEVYAKELENTAAEEFAEIGKYVDSFGNNATVEKEESAKTLASDAEKLKKIEETLDGVIDDSSENAKKSALEIIGDIGKWRNQTAYAYLHFKKSKYLDYAQKSAEEWKNRLVGVSKKNPRAKDVGEIKPFDDQMSEYCK